MEWLFDNWFVKKSTEIIYGNIYEFAQDAFNEAFKLLTDLVIMDVDINHYFNVDRYMGYLYILAASFLGLTVVWEVFKQISGNMIPTEDKSIGTILLRATWAGCMIYFLPWSVQNIFLRSNNALIDFIQYIGIEYDLNDISTNLFRVIDDLSRVLIIGIAIVGIGVLILGIISGIRYVEMIIAYIAAPFVAISVINGGEGLSVWVRETASIIFTQALHVFLLQFLSQTIARSGNSLFYILISIGILVVMVKGPAILRKYIYRAGVGSSSVQAVGSAGRFAAFKYIASSAKPL